MGYVIRFAGHAGETVLADAPMEKGLYLKSYDPEAFEGRGESIWSAKREDAFVFGDLTEVYETYNTMPAARPFREDGKPNKPLTAYHIEVEAI